MNARKNIFWLCGFFLAFFSLELFFLNAEEKMNKQTGWVSNEQETVQEESQPEIIEQENESLKTSKPEQTEISKQQVVREKAMDSSAEKPKKRAVQPVEKEQSAQPVRTAVPSGKRKTVKEKLPDASEPEAMIETEIEYTVPLKEIIAYHEKEITSAKQLIERWNYRFRDIVKKQIHLKSDIDSLVKEICEKKTRGHKENKKEISKMEKQLDRLKKEERWVKKEIESMSKDMAKEISQLGKESRSVVQEKFQQILKMIETQASR